MAMKNRFAEWLPELTEWRQDFHAHPELMFDTHRTAAVVAEKLREFGCDSVHEGVGRTGVIGVIKGRQDSTGKVIGLRADMDALPINETTGASYASNFPGKMHACGHDGHTTMLLGAARYLAETRAFDGTVVLIFQPAEEGGGGARVMVEEGVLDQFGIQEVYGMHNWPGQPMGSFAIREGAFFAATDQFQVTVAGRGGHAAKPHDTVDSALVAAQMIVALQSIVSRNADPVHQLVLSVTGVKTETYTHNVISERTEFVGTIRSLDPDLRELALERLTRVVEGVAAGFGAEVEVEIMHGYPVMVNHAVETGFAAEVARSVSGSCASAPLVLGGEDFAYMLNERPGAYILVGNGDTAMIHQPDYDFNDEAIPAGCSWWVGMVEQRLALGEGN